MAPDRGEPVAEQSCVVCGLVVHVREDDEPGLAVCGATCVAEAEREIPLAAGRIHQLETLRDRATAGRAWHVLLHPSVRTDVRDAEEQISRLRARIELLERAIATWHAHRAQRRGRPLGLGPRTFSRHRHAAGADTSAPRQ